MARIFPQGPPERVGVALSGGVDSMVLLQLLKSVFPHVSVHAITVDHGLRAESAREAVQVGQIATSAGATHTTLMIRDKINPAQLELDARHFRYNLLSKYCKDHAIKYVFLAHHQDDQLETTTMRLLKNSSIFGLRGMASMGQMVGITTVRPLLDVSKDDLYSYARENRVEWVEDPSNSDRNLTLRNDIRHYLRCDPHLKKDISLLSKNVYNIVESIEASMKKARGEMRVTDNEELGCVTVEIGDETLVRFHDVVFNRLLYIIAEHVSPDPQYQYKFRKFDSTNTGIVDHGFSLIEHLRNGLTVQLVHCTFNSKVCEGRLEITIKRQPEGITNRAQTKILLDNWVSFDNRFIFRFTNPCLEGLRIVNYNYKLHYHSLRNKRVNTVAKAYQLPVVVTPTNDVVLFPTLGGCESKPKR